MRFSIGASVFRVIAALAILSEYLRGYEERHQLFGPAAWPWDASIQASSWYFEICFHLALLVAVLWLLGWRTRWTTALSCLFWWLLEPRFPTLMEGGDELLGLVLVFAVFADVSAHFSLDALRRRGQPRRLVAPRVAAMLHNAAILALAIQMSAIYELAGLDMLQRRASLLPGLDHATLLFLVSFPLLVFGHRYTRLFAVGLAVMFHAGLGLLHGLVTFSLLMTAVSASLVDDDVYRVIGRRLVRLARSTRKPRAHAGPDDPCLDGATMPSDWR